MRSKFKWIFTLLLALSMQFSFAQQKTVSGVVTDGDGATVPFANVTNQTTKVGVQTDLDGKYEISAKVGETLVYSFVGMAEQTVKVGAANSYNVKMKMAGTEIEGLVVGALGIRKTANEQTSAVAVVSSKILTQAQSPNIVQSLAGKVSGLQINQTSNGVNGDSRILLRGNRSITSPNGALVVIDNVISSATVLGQLPPEIVDNVTILKGMQGAALYGQAGINGAIIVTTKQGSGEDKLNISINSSVDFESVSFIPERQKRYGQGWAINDNFSHISYENGGWGPEFDGTLQPVGLPQADGNYIYAPYKPTKNGIRDFFQTGAVYQNGVTMRSGSVDKGYMLLSLNRNKTEFVVKDDELDRTNVLFKAGRKIGKWFVEGNANYYTQSAKYADPGNFAGLYDDLLMTASNIPVKQFSQPFNQYHWTYFYLSPNWKRDNIRAERNRDFLSAIGTVGYDINKNINIKYVANAQFFQNNLTRYANAYNDPVNQFIGGPTQSQTSSFSTNNTASRNFYADLLINFDYMIGENLSFKLNLGNNVVDRLYKITSTGGTNLEIPGYYNIKNVLNPTSPSALDNQMQRYRSYSFFANLDLGYKDFIFLNATARNDNTSNFSAGNRAYFYPSVGISLVPFKAFDFRNDVFNDLKLTASFVRVGNGQGVDTYAINQLGFQGTGYPFGTQNSYVIQQNQTDPNIKPEFLETKEVGARFGFFKDRITLEGSYFFTKTTDLITQSSASAASGLNTLQINIGEAQTKGYEADLVLNPLRSADPTGFNWTMRFSYATSKMIVTKVSDDAKEVALLSNLNIGSNAQVGIFAVEGEEFPLIKGTAYVRDNNGRILVDETTGDPLTTSTFEKLGKSNPNYILGFTNSFDYKGIRLTAVLDYRTGHQFYSDVKYNFSWAGHLVESTLNGRTGFIYPNSSYLDSNTGQIVANTSVISAGGSNGQYIDYFGRYSRVGENFVIDATAFKVRELSLSYGLSDKLLERTGLSNVRFGINARNPFTVLPKQNRNYADPETSATNDERGAGLATTSQYPPTRTLGFSVNVSF